GGGGGSGGRIGSIEGHSEEGTITRGLLEQAELLQLRQGFEAEVLLGLHPLPAVGPRTLPSLRIVREEAEEGEVLVVRLELDIFVVLIVQLSADLDAARHGDEQDDE
ncbi:hypothetical protein PMAYCL1PPCAC_26714, partial [Pristionchus mayeri]